MNQVRFSTFGIAVGEKKNLTFAFTAGKVTVSFGWSTTQILAAYIRGVNVVTALRKAWRRVMLIVLMPDTVMGRVAVDENAGEPALRGAVEAREQ
jgi:hypothetical protein